MIEALERAPRAARSRGSTTEWFLLAPLLLLLALAPLPFGSTRAWAWLPLAIGVGVLLVGYGALVALNRADALGLARVHLLLPACAFVVVALSLAQALLPIGPVSPVWDMARSAGVPGEPRMSLSPPATLAAVARLMMYYGVFLLAVALTHRRKMAQAALWTLLAVTVAYALFGVANHVLTGSARTLFYLRNTTGGSHFGLGSTFIYVNAFAAYAALGLLLALHLCVSQFDRLVPPGMGISRSVRFALSSGSNSLVLFTVFAVILLSGCIIASLSRGVAAAAAVAGLAYVVSAIALRGGSRGDRVMGGLTVVLVLAAILAPTGWLIVDRLGHLAESIDVRERLYGSALAAIDVAPWTGWGLGTFSLVYPLFQGMGVRVAYNEAHSTVLEFLVDLGIVGGIAALAPGFYLFLLYLRTAVSTGSRTAVLGLAICLFAALQGALDFTLQIPAVALTLAFILGLTFGRCSRRLGDTGSTA